MKVVSPPVDPPYDTNRPAVQYTYNSYGQPFLVEEWLAWKESAREMRLVVPLAEYPVSMLQQGINAENAAKACNAMADMVALLKTRSEAPVFFNGFEPPRL